MTNRSIGKALGLSVITLGIYWIVWTVKVKDELNAMGAEIPTAWWMIVPGANIWWVWKYAEGVEKVTKEKYTAAVAFMLLFLTGFIGTAILQTEFNKLAVAPAK